MLYTLLAILVAAAIPLLFLYLVRRLDLYASGSFLALQVTFIWGLIAFFLGYAANTLALSVISLGVLTLAFAPLVEELLKSLALVYYIRRPDFTYFVDGAIYGFAAGIAFSIFENYLYLAQAPRNDGNPTPAGGHVLHDLRALDLSPGFPALMGSSRRNPGAPGGRCPRPEPVERPAR